jgi:predicted RNA-binding Zn-ribbon protein involved in translation (DUF1610 family)
MSEKLDDEICSLLKTVADHFDQEDRAVRERQIRRYRLLKLYWNNFSQVYWSEKAQDYRVYNQNASSSDSDQEYYDKPINVFKAFLETIIAALSIQIPGINCVPDDAENPLDVSTAKAGDKIAELVYKHNDVIFLWLHALYIYCTESPICCYNYIKEDKEYGTVEKPKYKDEEIDAYVCPQCGARVPDNMFDPSDEDIKEEEDNPPLCVECEAKLDPQQQKVKLKIPRLVGTTSEPKSRVCLEVYGGLYVKIANYAKKQKDTPYLNFDYETHYANALECYQDLYDKFPHGGWSNIGTTDPYEQYGRMNTQYRGEVPDENVTVKNRWFRPAAFNILPEEDCKRLKKKFPDGARFVMINDIPAEYKNESLDDHWTIAINPMSDFLNHDPLGELLTNVQDIINDLISLTLQTIEHGIAQTWADPAVVNFNAQRQIEAQPGTLTATKPTSGSRNIGESFYTSQTASLSPEVFNFYKIVQELGQFVSGALPSIFGGSQGAGSSRTASEYAMSKGMALQRLQTPWRMMTIWWKKIFGKVIPMYMKNMIDDERIVERNDAGKFINIFIRRAEIDGKIGFIELEPDEKLPVSDEQQADIIMQLMQLNNAEVTSALMDPENLPYISKIIKIPQFHLPGQEDKEKQHEEIDELINSVPIPPSPESMQLFQQAQQLHQQDPQHQQNGIPPPEQPQEQPSVEIDQDVDDHAIEAKVCKSWLISPAGRLAKKENPDGYRNVLLHMKAHMTIVNQQMQAQQLHDDQLQLAGVKGKPKTSDVSPGTPPAMKPKQSEKITGARNAQAPIS